MNEHAAWWQPPFVVGLLGLGLVIGGWKVATYVPQTPRQAQQQRLADDLRRGADGELARKVDEYERSAQGQPPYRIPGRVLLFAGLALFVTAGVRMYRRPPASEQQAGATPGRADEAVAGHAP